jgi:hypothetical protein
MVLGAKASANVASGLRAEGSHSAERNCTSAKFDVPDIIFGLSIDKTQLEPSTAAKYLRRLIDLEYGLATGRWSFFGAVIQPEIASNSSAFSRILRISAT